MAGPIWSGLVAEAGTTADQNARREDRFPEADQKPSQRPMGAGGNAKRPGRRCWAEASRTSRGDSWVGGDPPVVDLRALAFSSTQVIARRLPPAGDRFFSPGPVTSASRHRIPGPRPPRVAPHRPPTRHPLPPVPRLPRAPRRRRFQALGVHALGPSVGSSRIFLLPAPLPPPRPGWPPVRPCPHCWRPVFPDTFPRTRMACAVRYEAHSATAVFPGQEAILVPTGLSTEMCC